MKKSFTPDSLTNTGLCLNAKVYMYRCIEKHLKDLAVYCFIKCT